MKPAFDRTTVSGVRALLSGRRRFVITFHKNPDGDALASAFLLGLMLRKKKLEFLIVSANEVPRRLSFFAGRFPSVKAPDYLLMDADRPFKDQLPERFKDAVLVVLDSSNPGRAGLSAEDTALFPDVLNIDHHSDNSLFGTLNCVDPRATSIGEILYTLMPPLGIRPGPEEAELVYISLYSDTVGFSQNNTSEKARTILCDLLRLKIGLPLINRELRKKSWKYLQLSGRVFGRLRKDDSAKPAVLWSSCLLEDMRATGLGYEDLDGVIHEMSFTGEAEIVFLLKELRPSEFKASIRSTGGYNAKKTALSFGGGGHDNAAGFEISGTPGDCAERIIAAVRRA